MGLIGCRILSFQEVIGSWSSLSNGWSSNCQHNQMQVTSALFRRIIIFI